MNADRLAEHRHWASTLSLGGQGTQTVERINELCDDADHAQSHIDALQAENERLRDAICAMDHAADCRHMNRARGCNCAKALVVDAALTRSDAD